MADGSKMVRVSVPDSKEKPTALTCSPQAQSTATQRTQKKTRIAHVHSGWNSRKGELLMALFVTQRSSTANFFFFLKTKIKTSRTA